MSRTKDSIQDEPVIEQKSKAKDWLAVNEKYRPSMSIADSSEEEYLISKKFEPPKLHQILSTDEIDELHSYFISKGGKLTPEDLRKGLEKYSIYYPNEAFESLFLKINTDRDWLCSWDEFVSYLILGFEDDEGDKDREELDPPIRERPVQKPTKLCHQIVRLTYFPTVQSDRSVEMSQGSYVVATADGTVNYYTLDWSVQRTGESPSPVLKIASTFVLDCICMPDIMIICISSTERDLRFYDTSANKHALRVHLIGLPELINTMHYSFHKDVTVPSKLVLGDYKGSIHLLEFNSENRGPFRSNSGGGVTTYHFKDIKTSGRTLFTYKSFANLHIDKVTQVEYCPSLNQILTSTEIWSEAESETAAAMYLIDLSVKKDLKVMTVKKGVSVFCFDPPSKILATGGPDWIVRLWSPFNLKKPTCILPGHHAGIDFIFIQDSGKKVYSLDKENVVKVWDIESQSLIQTYNRLLELFDKPVPLKSFYNNMTREFIATASKNFLIMKCCPLIELDVTDGETHTRPVSVVLYNDLFNVVITCGFDSLIIVWDPWTGSRLNLIKMAHSTRQYDLELRIEITAACFDTKKQLLLTGARDGTLKVWNFNNGFCVRHLNITRDCEVTAVFWVPDRILAVGWNKFVYEFADGVETKFPNGKMWEIQHEEEVLCAAIRPPHTLVTASYSGEIVFWRFETGQAYKKFDVEDPLTPVKIIYINKRKKKEESYKPKYKPRLKKKQSNISNLTVKEKASSPSVKSRALSIITLPKGAEELQCLSIQAAVFLNLRPMKPNWGTLLTALSDGRIFVWSHHNLSGYLEQFNAIHMAGDSVTTMKTEPTETYLFTGTMLGYVKIWLLTNYCVPESEHQHVSLPKLRLNFPFLRKTVFLGRAKRTVKHQQFPMLLNSFKGHKKAVTGIDFIAKSNILLTSSVDCSVRLWSLSGRYIGTFGSPVRWVEIEQNEPIGIDYPYRIPPDIKREASFTTLQVFTDGETHPVFKKPVKLNDEDEESAVGMGAKQKARCIYGKPLKDPILGNHFSLPERPKIERIPSLDFSLPYIPVWSHVKPLGAERECDQILDPQEKLKENLRRSSLKNKLLKDLN